MRALELKDIAGYLPYGLRVEHGQHIGTETLFEACYHPIPADQRVVCGINTKLKLSEIKPILRPMSDLSREITHKGETFVPLDRIRAISRFFEFDDCGLLFMRNGCTQSEWLQVFELLSEWKFDYRGLIPAGLAIDVNTLPENPYEK